MKAQETLHAKVRDGVGKEVTFPKPGDNFGAVRSSVNSLSDFMHARSGVGLSGQTKNRLAEMEANTLAGNARRITPNELSDILADVALARITALSDADIDHATETLRGFDAPDLPQTLKNGRDTVKLRAGKHSDLTPERFAAQVKAIRGADDASRAIFRGAAQRAIAAEVQSKINFLSIASPDQFSAASSGLTPMQATLITYSAASEDLLADSATNLRKKMESTQKGASQFIGQNYPSPVGHTAYGVNGYLFSSPLDLVFDEQTVNLVLNRIAERSAIQ